jgi:phage virion morphogenesis protein
MSGFRKLAENLARLASVPSRIAKPAAARINQLIAVQFSSGQDPYGKAWTPLMPSTVKRKRGDTRILIRTGNMSVVTAAASASGSGIELTSTQEGTFHQFGTVNMVARPIFPGKSNLPVSWRLAISEEYKSAFGKAML